MPIVLCSESKNQNSDLLVAGESPYSNHKFSFFYFFTLQSSFRFPHIIIFNMHKQLKEHYSALKWHLLPKYRLVLFFFCPTKS